MVAVNRLMQGDVSKLHLLNSAYITLIPKTVEALEVKDYRPISLIHSFTKIITKILANKLAVRLPILVSQCQSAFVKGRCIHDSFTLVEQGVVWWRRLSPSPPFLAFDVALANNQGPTPPERPKGSSQPQFSVMSRTWQWCKTSCRATWWTFLASISACRC
jgi:hypothetical protein